MVEKTCTEQELCKEVSGLVFLLFLLMANEDESEEDEEWGLVYIGGEKELIRSVE